MQEPIIILTMAAVLAVATGTGRIREDARPK